MQSKTHRICHDLKTDRLDIGRPLPGILRLLPIGLYLCCVATLALSALFFWQFKNAQEERDLARGEEAAAKTEQSRLTTEAAAITAEAKRAEDARKWVQGSEPMQDLVVAITRSMRPTSSLGEFGLVRDKDDPRKLSFTLQVNAGGPEQLDMTLGKVATDLNYRPYFAQRKEEKGGAISYSATLLKQERKDQEKAQAANGMPAPAIPVMPK